jgi:hypothetical protein
VEGVFRMERRIDGRAKKTPGVTESSSARGVRRRWRFPAICLSQSTQQGAQRRIAIPPKGTARAGESNSAHPKSSDVQRVLSVRRIRDVWCDNILCNRMVFITYLHIYVIIGGLGRKILRFNT